MGAVSLPSTNLDQTVQMCRVGHRLFSTAYWSKQSGHLLWLKWMDVEAALNGVERQRDQ